MKHLIIVLESTLGGTRKYCADLLQRIDLASYRVTYIYATARADKSFFADLAWMRQRGITLVEIPMVREVSLRADLRAFVALFRYFRAHPYDIVHAHSSKAGFLSRLASKLARPSARTIYQPHMMAFQISRWYLHLERFAALFTDLVIADSASERRAIIEHGIVPRGKVRAVNAGIDVPSSDEGVAQPGDGRFTVGAVARLTYPKDPDTFITAASILASRGHRVRFVWVGDGDLLEACRTRVREQQLEHVVEFLGWVPEALGWMRSFDILVHSSYYESFGYSLAEAMSFRKPVVASDVTGVSDLVEAGVTGFLFPAGDAVSMAGFVERLLKDPTLVGSMGRAGRERVERLFTVERMVVEIQAVYAEVQSDH
ncbi:MAG: glycosyltransferase family 4 protein [Bacteroidetes bacterium]|jgi:glycosyltransferase involved in cell wall biosynthesis|nr:glycosyltransferase family 4 protein [Bacteroidota bacterium]